MSAPRKKADELRTAFQMFLSPAEIRAIDDWRFARRISSRGEAIRKLCEIGLAYSAVNVGSDKS